MKWVWRLLGVGILLTIAFAFYQPPMRLMPTPTAFLDGAPNAFAANPKLAETDRIEIFYATNRLPVGPRNNRIYTMVPGLDLHFGIATLGIGGGGKPWDAIYEFSTTATEQARPRLPLLNMNERGTEHESGTLTPGTRALFAKIDRALANSRDPDITIYVHGANSTVERAAGQAAQFRHFTGQNSVVLLYAWPSIENFLRYPTDVQRALSAGPQLARVIALLGQHTRVRKIDVLTYSAGGMVGSAGLAEVGRNARVPGARDPQVGEVYHAGPDADFRDFVDEAKDYTGVADRVTVALNRQDIALWFSEIVNRNSRAGRPDVDELTPQARAWLYEAAAGDDFDIVNIRPGDIAALWDRSHSFWYNDPWVSSDVLIAFVFDVPAAERGLAAGRTGDGFDYRFFPPDYEARLVGVLAGLRDKVAGPATVATAQ